MLINARNIPNGAWYLLVRIIDRAVQQCPKYHSLLYRIAFEDNLLNTLHEAKQNKLYVIKSGKTDSGIIMGRMDMINYL